jgi:hypothetical protein
LIVLNWRMLRFSSLLRLLVSVAFVLALAPIAAQYVLALTERPELGDVAPQAGLTVGLAAMTGQSWWMPTLLFIGGLTLGVWADWCLRQLDNGRRTARKGFGARLTRLAEDLARLEFTRGPNLLEWPKNLGGERRAVTIALARLEKFGIWNPGRAAFQIPRGGEFLVDFFREIGMLLQDERFEEAKARAHAAKLRFELIGLHP